MADHEGEVMDRLRDWGLEELCETFQGIIIIYLHVDLSVYI